MTARSPRPPLSPPRPRPDAGSTAAAAAERTQHERGRDRRPTRTLQPVAIDHALGARARSCIVAQRADRERPRVSARCIVPALAAALASRERRRRRRPSRVALSRKSGQDRRLRAALPKMLPSPSPPLLQTLCVDSLGSGSMHAPGCAHVGGLTWGSGPRLLIPVGSRNRDLVQLSLHRAHVKFLCDPSLARSTARPRPRRRQRCVLRGPRALKRTRRRRRCPFHDTSGRQTRFASVAVGYG